jgi:hypothetical protein
MSTGSTNARSHDGEKAHHVQGTPFDVIDLLRPAAHPLPRTYTFRTRRIFFWHRSMTGSQTGFATADMRTAARAPLDSLPQRLP